MTGACVYGSLPRLSEKVVAKLQRWRRLSVFREGVADIFTRYLDASEFVVDRKRIASARAFVLKGYFLIFGNNFHIPVCVLVYLSS
ncbi:hypothetical protein DPMN_100225 [Dreissena polymorpha]|uniref:Uncharacterized protein n=1 Tax=Dreissena polymorpha TaxID=45954 RepID=A0A9D4LGX9_DREPO|nr:hypothetical protein DPMN_100225 [Dreissena polymorpha]